jgi:hypothetical protein
VSGEGYVLENDLAGEPHEGFDCKALSLVEMKMLPFLCRGLVESNSDCEGHAGYRLTPDGHAALQRGMPELSGRRPKYSPTAGDAYDDAQHVAEAERAGWKISDKSHLAIPLSAGLWHPPLSEASNG